MFACLSGQGGQAALATLYIIGFCTISHPEQTSEQIRIARGVGFASRLGLANERRHGAGVVNGREAISKRLSKERLPFGALDKERIVQAAHKAAATRNSYCIDIQPLSVAHAANIFF